MHPLAKVVIGAVLLIGGVAWTYYYWASFVRVILGVIGPLVAILGLFIVWLELDELRIERELKSEEKKTRKGKR